MTGRAEWDQGTNDRASREAALAEAERRAMKATSPSKIFRYWDAAVGLAKSLGRIPAHLSGPAALEALLKPNTDTSVTPEN